MSISAVSAKRAVAVRPQPTAINRPSNAIPTAARVSRIDAPAFQKNKQPTSQSYLNRAVNCIKAIATHPVTKTALLAVAANSVLHAAGYMPAFTRPLTAQGIYDLATSGISSLINTVGKSSTLDPNGTTPYESLYEVLSQKCEAPRIFKAIGKVAVIEDLKFAGAITGAIIVGVVATVGTLFCCYITGEKAAANKSDQDEDLEAQPIQVQAQPTFLSKALNSVMAIATHPTTRKTALFALAANSILHAADVMPAWTRFLTVQETASGINSFFQRAFFEPPRPDDFIFANPLALTMFYTPLVIWEITFGSLYCCAKQEKHREGARENLLLIRAVYVLATSIIGTATACEYFFGKGPGA